MRQIVAPGSWPTGPPAPATTQTINEEWNAEHSARHTALLYASLRSAFHAWRSALRAQRSAETELGMQLCYTPRSAPLRAAQLRCANVWIKDSYVLPPAGGSSLAFPASQATQASLSNQLRWSLRSAPRRSAPRARGVPRVTALATKTDPPQPLLAGLSLRLCYRVWFRHKHAIKCRWK